jgi:hypothetical protein
MIADMRDRVQALLGLPNGSPITEMDASGGEDEEDDVGDLDVALKPLARMLKTASKEEKTVDGRLFIPIPERSTRKKVPLQVESRQAEGLYLSWSQDGQKHIADVVEGRRWTHYPSKQRALSVARILDAMTASGLSVANEAAGEVGLRGILALWYRDKFPTEAKTAELMRAHSETFAGIPTAALKEANKFVKMIPSGSRKFQKKDDDDAEEGPTTGRKEKRQQWWTKQKKDEGGGDGADR